MLRASPKGFKRDETICIRENHGSVPRGSLGTVVEVFWVAEHCLVEFAHESFVFLPWNLLDRVMEAKPLKEREVNGT
jgi:hypothetical protein